MAALIFKNFIINKLASTKYVDYWVQTDNEFKQGVKTQFMKTLGSPKSVVRSQIAQILAAIASIELPKNEWPELIPTLCEYAHLSEEQIDLKHASLQTLQYICEDLKPADLKDEEKDKIIQALVINISTDPEKLKITNIAIKALISSIAYANKCFSNPTD